MSWTVPRVWGVLEEITAAKMNEISAALNDLDRRTTPVAATVSTSQTTSSTSYSDLGTIGPTASATIGSTNKGLVTIRAALANANVPVASLMGVAISGGITLAAADANAVGITSAAAGAGFRAGIAILYTLLGVGNCNFTAKYRSDPGGTLTAVDRYISVTPLGS